MTKPDDHPNTRMALAWEASSMLVPDGGDKDMDECCVLVVGGTSGIGLASAVRLARAGAPHIVLVGRDPDRGAKAVDNVSAEGATVHFVSGDLTVPEEAERVVAAAVERMGTIDVLVTAVAPEGNLAPVEHSAVDEMVRFFTALALAPMLATKSVIPVMKAGGGGSIITLASDAAKVPTPGEATVGAGMAAITMFTRTVAMEVKRHHIRANVLTPSLVLETGTSERIKGEEFATKIFDRISKKADLGVPTADDVAQLVEFLAGPGSSKITGQVISVNGGVSAG